ncbi:YebC-like protein [Pholiota conissans]|uniref:YebC-like protein n=1 Tax=Pholiota conissans TaxID=109636 RepID=A0A9P6CY88_9AGAR|nr:YebC-like protein [Pholiota conissans]
MFQLASNLFLRTPPPPRSNIYPEHQAEGDGLGQWSKIKDKKAAHDGQKSILYARVNHEIAVAVKRGGSFDPEKNAQLAVVLKKAKEQGVPKDNIAKSLARCMKGEDRSGERFTYEAIVGGSVGIIIECITDNVNRTIHNVREILTTHGARMAPVNFMFTRQGCITVTLDRSSDTFGGLVDVALENGATDYDEASKLQRPETSYFWFYCEPQDVAALEDAIAEHETPLGVRIESAEIAYIPVERSPEVDAELKEKVQELVQALEENVDTLRVWTSLDFER